MELLGHSAIAVTMNIYSHVMPAATRTATDLIGDLLADDDDRRRTTTTRRKDDDDPQDDSPDDEAPDAA